MLFHFRNHRTSACAKYSKQLTFRLSIPPDRQVRMHVSVRNDEMLNFRKILRKSLGVLGSIKFMWNISTKID